MKLSDLDRHPTTGTPGPIAQALRWLGTCLKSPAATWTDEQRAEATIDLAAARATLEADALTLAGMHSADKGQEGWRPSDSRREFVLSQIDRAEAEAAAAIRAEEARRFPVAMLTVDGGEIDDLEAIPGAKLPPDGGYILYALEAQEKPLAMTPPAGFCRCGGKVEECDPNCPHRDRTCAHPRCGEECDKPCAAKVHA